MSHCRALSSSAFVSPTPKYAFAIVGSGPAGMYAVEKLLNLERKTVKGKTTDSDTTPTTHSTTMKKKVVIRVDVYEKECFPYGLVRYGVAPDHAATKNVTKKFDALLRDARVRLFANVKVGDETSRVDAAAVLLLMMMMMTTTKVYAYPRKNCSKITPALFSRTARRITTGNYRLKTKID